MNKVWKYFECPQCMILYPHLVVPEICACGHDMRKHHHTKTLRLISYANVLNPALEKGAQNE